MEFPSKTLQPLKYQISLEGGGHSNIPFNQRAHNTVPLTLIFASTDLVNSRITAKNLQNCSPAGVTVASFYIFSVFATCSKLDLSIHIIHPSKAAKPICSTLKGHSLGMVDCIPNAVHHPAAVKQCKIHLVYSISLQNPTVPYRNHITKTQT